MVVTVTINPAVDKTYIVEQFTPGGLNRAVKILYNAGSKGINVARVLKQLNHSATVLGFVGGRDGSVLLSELAADGISEDLIRVEGNTRLNIKIMDLHTRQTTEVNEPGMPVTAKELEAFEEKYRGYVPKCRAVVISGSILPEMYKREYFDLVSIAKKAGKPVFLDCGGALLHAGMEGAPTYIKPNYREFCDMVGKRDLTREEIAEHAKRIIRQYGVEKVVVTCGRAGALGFSADEAYEVLPPDVEVLSTVGAGDAFLAGLCHGYLNGLNFKAQLVLATSFSNAKITKEGNDIPSLVELLGYAEGCAVKPLS